MDLACVVLSFHFNNVPVRFKMFFMGLPPAIYPKLDQNEQQNKIKKTLNKINKTKMELIRFPVA